MGHFLKELIELGGHVVLGGGKAQLIGSEFGNDLFNRVHVGLGASGFSHDSQ